MRLCLRSAAAVATVLLVACAAPSDEAETAGVSDPAPSEATPSEIEPTGTDQEALDSIAEAAAATTDAGSADFAMTIETAGTAGADGMQPISVTGEEDFDAQQRRMTFQGPGGELEVLVDNAEVYVEIPATEDEQWARVELDDLIGDGVGFGGPGGLPFQSPHANLAVLTDSVAAAQEGGTEDVDGATATRYDLTIDLEDAAENLEEAGDTVAVIAAESGLTEMDMQVWVDEEDLIRRVAYTLDLAQVDVEPTEVEGAEVEADPAGVVTVTVEYSDHGAPVDITLPEESSIVDIDEDELRSSMPQASPAP